MTKSNQRKYFSYAEAWRRIKLATEGGFYFEVVALCESIISDRLLSYIKGVDGESNFNSRTNFGTLIGKWRKLAAGSLPASDARRDLGSAVDAWREDRNTVVHGLAKSEPGRPTEDLSTFLSKAEMVAKEGRKLARAVSDWHKQQLRHREG